MAIQDDWTIDYAAKTITHTSGTTVYTALALYSWLQDVFDDLSQLDDDEPMSAQTPTAFTLINGWSIPAASFEFLSGGAVTDTTNDDLWSNMFTLGGIESGTNMIVEQNGGIVAQYWPAGHIDVLIRVRQAGALINSGLVTVHARELSDAFDTFEIDLSGGGRNPVPIATSNDNENQGAPATLASYADVTVTFGAITRNLNNGAGARPYRVEIDCAGRPLAQVYERLKYITRRGATGLLNGVQGQLYQKADPAYVATKSAPFGTFAGGTFFGAQGVWLTNLNPADVKAFQLIDGNGVAQAPPNVVGVGVTALQIGDRVGVFRLTAPGGVRNKAEYALAAGNSSGATTLTVKAPISSDTPPAGVVAIGDDLYAYSSYAGSTFTLAEPLTTSYAENAEAYVPLILEEAASAAATTSLVHAGDIPVLVIVRRRGIQPFRVETAITAAGLNVAAIRTTDNVVT